MSGDFWNQLWHVRHSHIYVEKKKKKLYKNQWWYQRIDVSEKLVTYNVET